jgi:hypothetical protein
VLLLRRLLATSAACILTFQGIPQILDLLFDFPSAVSGGEENIIRILALFFQLRLHAIEANRFLGFVILQAVCQVLIGLPWHVQS